MASIRKRAPSRLTIVGQAGQETPLALRVARFPIHTVIRPAELHQRSAQADALRPAWFAAIWRPSFRLLADFFEVKG